MVVPVSSAGPGCAIYMFPLHAKILPSRAARNFESFDRQPIASWIFRSRSNPQHPIKTTSGSALKISSHDICFDFGSFFGIAGITPAKSNI